MYNGQKIKEILRDRGITNSKLLEKLGWKSNNQLSQLVAGNPKADTLERICDALEIPIDTLFERKDYAKKYKMSKREAEYLNVIKQQKQTIDALHALLEDIKQ